MKFDKMVAFVNENQLIEKAEQFLQNKTLPVAEFAYNVTKGYFTLNMELKYDDKDEYIIFREHKRKIEWYALPIPYCYTLYGNHCDIVEI